MALDRHPPLGYPALDRHPPAPATPANPAPPRPPRDMDFPSTVAGKPAPPSTPYVPIDAASMNDPNPKMGKGRGRPGPPKKSKGLATLRRAHFPADLVGNQATWMEITSFKRTGTAIGANHSPANYTSEASAGIGGICLPIPAGTGASYGQSWDQSDISMITEAALEYGLPEMMTSMSNSSVKPNSGTTSMFDAASSVVGSAATGGLKALKGIQEGISSQAMRAMGIKSAGDVIASLGGGPGGLQAATGFQAFNEVVVHYSGPQFRTFDFSFSLKPKSPDDQTKIRQIVQFLKEGSYPNLLDSGNIGRVYEIPLFFKIKFYANGEEIQHMHRIGMCALTGLGVKFGGDRFQTFASTNDPVQTDITMSFKEMSLLHRSVVKDGF